MNEYHVLEILAVTPEFQRRGIGGKLMEAFVKDLEKQGKDEGRGCVIVSSEAGKGLYEKWGWKVVGGSEIELKEWGVEKTWVNFVMKKEGEDRCGDHF